ncbi:SigE family RNA polymerase sigma factor [Nocardioides hankookensis]|uniref:SigE family RNA polymerase sigma factor n=1 Tax=Nocardioides hankookensis TaxID=443157 RepID=A0ABW1LMZ4_9ACTN
MTEETRATDGRWQRTTDFEEFVAARSAALWRSAYLLTGDVHKAEDLLQIALVKAWRRWDTISRRDARESYVRAALTTTYTDWWRRRWNGEVPTASLPDNAAMGRGETAGVDVRRDVLAALARLPRGQRAVVVLRYFDDLTEQQTADALGVRIGTVKSQTSRALATLRTSPLFATETGDIA